MNSSNETVVAIDLSDPEYHVSVLTSPNVHLDCVYIRPNGDRFELVAQRVTCIGDDFTFDETVLLSDSTPLLLLRYLHSGAIPPLPSLRTPDPLSPFTDGPRSADDLNQLTDYAQKLDSFIYKDRLL